MRHSGWTFVPTSIALILACALPAVATPSGRTADGAVIVLAKTATDDGFGAGTIVAKSGDLIRVLTANHVASHGALSIRFDGGAVYPARIVSEFPSHDLAVIEAEVDPILAGTLHPAPVAVPRSHEPVHIWGSGVNGPAFETASIAAVGAQLPDGPANGRYALGCSTCHEGDSGGGVFDAQGELVGVYVGYFVMDAGPNVSVAQLPSPEALRIARAPVTPDATVASVDFSK
jgi:S1-C subfamily serine protease